MFIDITTFIQEADPFEFSHSRAEGGPTAARDTFNAALAEAKERPLLTSKAEIAAMRNWAKDTGAWDNDEIDSWDDAHCNALFIQLVSADIREANLDLHDAAEVREYNKRAERGEVRGNIVVDHEYVLYYLGD